MVSESSNVPSNHHSSDDQEPHKSLSVTKTTSTCQGAMCNWRGSKRIGLKLKLAGPMGLGSQYSYLRATRTSVDADTIHIAPCETYIKNVLEILGLGDNMCKPIPTSTVQTRQKSDEDEPRLGEEDCRAYHRCTGILRHLLKYRPDIAFAVHEVSKTLDRPVMQTSQDCDDLAGWERRSLES